MAVKFLPPIANASQFPTPVVSATPDFHLWHVNVLRSSAYALDKAIFTRNGRGAIGIAGRALKKPGKNVILIPAYHCPALVEPFIWLDYEIRFYPVQANLSVDQQDLETALAAGDVTHCVVVRYFGFNQNVDQTIAFLQDKNVAIVEDCAHSMFRFLHHFGPNSALNSPVNASICSINKILPTVDGGALYMANPVDVPITQTGWVEEFKAFAYLMGVPQLIDRVRSGKASRHTLSLDNEAEDHAQVEPPEGLRYFKPVDIESASYRHTHYLLKRSNIERIRGLRRDHFQRLLKGIQNPEVGAPLYTELTDLDVPYVFPFLLRDDKHFFTLRKKGIQILRWEEVAISDCAISTGYRSCLIQIPCHHLLTDEQLNYVINTINELQP